MLADRVRMTGRKPKRLIDRTPVNITIQNVRTRGVSGIGGRKLVSLGSGWLVVAFIKSTGWELHISKDYGDTWGLLYDYGSITTDIALSAIGNGRVAVLNYFSPNKLPTCYIINCSNGLRESLHNFPAEIDMGNMSMETNKGRTEIHACWSSKSVTHPNSFNIRYAKGIINGDGSVTWGNVEQVTNHNSNVSNNRDPTMIIQSEKPCIIYSYDNLRITCLKFDGSLWRAYVVYGSTSQQSSPSACVDKSGVIHVAWHGVESDNPYFYIRYKKSMDGGVTWTTGMEVPTANGLNPSIAVDSGSVVSITYHTTVNQGYYVQFVNSIGTPIPLGTTFRYSDAHLLQDINIEFKGVPPMTYGKLTSSFDRLGIEFQGKWQE